SDQLFDSLARVLGIDENAMRNRPRPMGMGGMRGGDRSPRGQFNQTYGFDPSTAPDEITGTLPQALFMMNSPLVNNRIRAVGGTQLADLLARFPNDDDALKELYMLVHAREPSAKELQVCREYLAQVGNRRDAFEDILWSAVNSTEFQTK